MTDPESVNRGRSRRPVPTIPRICLNDEGDLSDESWDSDGTYVNEAEKDKVNRPGSSLANELKKLTVKEETKELMELSPEKILTRFRRRSQSLSRAKGEAEGKRREGNTRHAENEYRLPIRSNPTTKTA